MSTKQTQRTKQNLDMEITQQSGQHSFLCEWHTHTHTHTLSHTLSHTHSLTHTHTHTHTPIQVSLHYKDIFFKPEKNVVYRDYAFLL